MKLFVFGLGYTSLTFVRRQAARFTAVTGTVRSPEKAEALGREGIAARVFAQDASDPAIAADLLEADAVLVSIPPGDAGDPVLARLGSTLAKGRAAWVGYLSTVGVYGDHDGAWVDETSALRPVSRRSVQRVAAEEAWLAFGRASGKPVHLFRLAGIYGPGRSPLQKVLDGTARRIVKPGQVFNRIHVEDIATILAASLGRPRPGGIYNGSDDEPAPPQDVVAYAAEIAGRPVPPEIAFADAPLTPMGRSFYGENKRVSNRRIHEELGVSLAYPTYREGLRSLLETSEAQAA